jgi:dolichol-phosphate mannosyltransferase
MSARVLVVIPACNEAETIAEVAGRSAKHADVCVVDDGSRDGTGEIARSIPRVHCIRHEKNTHIAGAILDGFRHGVECGYDFCVTMDAGLSHDPDALPLFLARQDADLVIGVRDGLSGVPLYRRGLSRGANFLMNLALERSVLPWGGARLRDCTSGYRMYSRRAFEMLTRADLRSRAFDFHIEALAFVFRRGMRIAEVPIHYRFSNSSLRPEIVREALGTCLRVWVTELR